MKKLIQFLTNKGICVLAVLFMYFLNGCKFYYEAQTVKPVTAQEIRKYDSEHKYFILHRDTVFWHLSGIEVNNESLTGNLSADVPAERWIYEITNFKGGHRYKKEYANYVLDQVHLYLQDSVVPVIDSSGHIKVVLSDIKKTDVYQKDKGRTTWSHLIPPLIIAGVAAVAIGIAVNAENNAPPPTPTGEGSCPFIYTSDGNSYALTGEIYGGAIYPSLERDDYMLLPGFKVVDNQYNLKIANELKERQNTNLADLLLISHPKNSAVYIDKYGRIQTATAKQSPISAITLNENDCLESFKAKDNNFFLFNDHNAKTSVNQVILTFENRQGADTGKLILNARNSLWADYTYGKFSELFGSYYPKWDEKQKKVSKEKLVKNSLKQDIPLSVYLETKKGWEFVDFFNVVGPVASRDMVMAVDLARAKSRNVRIKLVTGFMFWQLDYAAMDFTGNLPVHTTLLKPSNAIDERGKDVLSILYNDDNQRLEQLEIGNEAIVKYDIPKENAFINNDSEQTICLHSKGYYEKIVDYKGKPDWAQLKPLKHAHSFSGFSLNEYEKSYNNLTIKK